MVVQFWLLVLPMTCFIMAELQICEFEHCLVVSMYL